MSASRPPGIFGHLHAGIQYWTKEGSQGWILDVVFCLRSSIGEPGQTGHARFHPYEPSGSINSNWNSRSAYTSLQGHLSEDRLLPLLPDFGFGRHDVLPQSFGGPLDDTPLSIYRRKRLLRALGHQPADQILPPARSVPRTPPVAPSVRTGQFRGDFNCIVWNAQAFFAVEDNRRDAKHRYLLSLLGRSDMVMITEAHGTAGAHAAWRPPRGCQAWWSPGPTTGHAGIGIVVKDSFLHNFSEKPIWNPFWPGRAGKLSLRGRAGALDLLVVYYHTGAVVTELDLYGVHPDQRVHCSNFPAIRAHLRHRVAQALAPPRAVLTLMAGDFNWVTRDSDRRALPTSLVSGRKDQREEGHFRNIIEQPFNFHELHQPDMTHAAANSRARLDRIYCNHHCSEQLDREIRAVALEWRQDLSHHRAVLASRKASEQLMAGDRGIPDHVINHEDFLRRTILAYEEKKKADPQSTGLRNLSFLKESIKEVSTRLGRETMGIQENINLEDRLGTTMRFLRALENQATGTITRCLHLYPALAELVETPYEFGGNLTTRLRRLRDHAIELARQHALDELGKATTAAKGGDVERAARAKKKYSHILYKLMPGRGGAVQAVQKKNGELATDADDMAATLRTHWSEVFTAKGVDTQLLRTWLDDDRAAREETSSSSSSGAPSHQVLRDLRITKRHVQKAIGTSKDSAPGPDGIPYRAWRNLGKLAVEVLHSALAELCSEDAERILQQEMPSFNESLLMFLPKKAAGTMEDGDQYFLPGGVRPLNITNTDNRLLASAVRIALEPMLAPLITQDQKGFLLGRSMVSNLLDIDEAMIRSAAEAEGAYAIFLTLQRRSLPSSMSSSNSFSRRWVGLPGCAVSSTAFIGTTTASSTLVGGGMTASASAEASGRAVRYRHYSSPPPPIVISAGWPANFLRPCCGPGRMTSRW